MNDFAENREGSHRILAVTAVFNEEKSIGRVIEGFHRIGLDRIAIMDDGSTDGTVHVLEACGVVVFRSQVRQGIGFAARTLLRYAHEQGYEILVVFAGNGKDDPSEVPRLLKPILEDGFDLVQGSRYLEGGGHHHMPLYRWIATRVLYAGLFFALTGRRLTDATNGFRAFRMSLLDDERINIDQDWLSQYELEPYILYKAVVLGYKVKEVPVTKTYPKGADPYTKMTPLISWWSILRPLFLLGFGIKR